MSYDGWITYNGTELVNLSRTAQLAQTLGIDTVWATPESMQWIEDAVGGADYANPANAPWYDPAVPASGEFAGIVSLGFAGLDDSTLMSSPIEYITDGGHSGKPRNETKSIVASVALVASTERGAEYGKRWMTRLLRDSGTRAFCSGADLRYFRTVNSTEIVHHRDVRQTRGTSITRKVRRDCSSTWFATFTLTAADPYEYGEIVPSITAMGDVTPPTGPGVVDSGQSTLVEQACPVFDYSPIFDPAHPTLVASPTAPDFYPDGWDIGDGDTFDRFWAKIAPVEPSDLAVVPMITFNTDFDAHMVRLCIWDGDTDPEDQCDPLFSVVLTYLPAGVDLIIDGEQKAVYVDDGASPVVRRADSLAYSKDANPLQWVSLESGAGLLVTLDVFFSGSDYEGEGTVSAAVAFVPKSD